MRIGIRLHDSAPGTLQERLAAVKAQGFECAHLALTKIPGLYSADSELTPGYALWLKKQFDEAGLDIAVLGNYLNLADPDPEKLQKIQNRYTAHLRFNAHLNGCMVGTETGAPNSDYHYDKEANHSMEALELFIKNLTPVVRAAESFGQLIAIEPVYKHIVYNPQRARQVLDRIASPNLRIIFDPVNLLDPDNLDHKDEVIDEAMAILAPEIAMIHLKDYRLENGKMKAVGCGFGEMDYTKIVTFTETQKPYIHATLENTTPETAVQSLQFIRNIAGQVQKER